MRAEQRRVDVDRHPLGGDSEIPGAGAGRLARRGKALEELRVGGDPLDHPIGRGVGGDLAEQRRLLADRAEVAKRLAAVGEHHGQVADYAARVVATLALAHR